MNRQQETKDKVRIFSQRLAARAGRLGLQQNEIAEKIGVEPAAVSNWWRGANAAKGKNLRRLADVLQCDADWLLGESDTQGPVQQTLREDMLEQAAMGPQQLRNSELAALARWLLATRSVEEINDLISKAAHEGRSDVARALLDVKDGRVSSAAPVGKGGPVRTALRQLAEAAIDDVKSKA